MKILRIGGIASACTVLASVAMAQVPSDTIKPGTVLNTSGIQLSAFGRPLPLPPGNWEVLRRANSEVKLTGEGPATAPKVNLTLRNTDAVAPLVAMVISYTPDAIQIRWNGNTPCENPSAQFIENFGTTTGSLNYACAIAYFNPGGFKTFIASTPSHTNAWVKENLSPLVPYLDAIPDRNIWSAITLNRDRGRAMEVAFISRPNPAAKGGEPFGTAARTWIRSTGKAYLDFLEGNASTVQPYPALEPAADTAAVQTRN